MVFVGLNMSNAKNIKMEYLEECANDIQFLAEEFLPHILTSQIPNFHSEIYQLLPETKRLVVAAPRGFAKSKVCSTIYPIWLGCFCLYKDITIISASETLAKEMLRNIKREFESNQKLRKWFGDLITEKWSETHATLKTGVTFRARGSEGQIRGFRPDCIILDDIETDETVKSEDQRRKVNDWIFKSCLPALVPDGQFIVVGSIISQLAILKQILDTENGWVKRIYRAYTDRIQQPGHELWPQLWNHEKLQARKAEIGSWAFSCFVAGTEVYTPQGLRNIETLSVGDIVYDKDLNLVEVKATGSREVLQLYKIWLRGYDKPLICSNNHPFLVYEPTFYRNRFFNHQNFHKAVNGNGGTKVIELEKDLVWKPAESLSGKEFCVFPINKIINPSMCPEFWWTIGRYLSEGCVSKNVVQICANKTEKHKLQRTVDYLETTEWRGRDYPRKIRDCGSIYTIYIGSKAFSKICREFGSCAGEKHLTQEAKNLDYQNFKSLLDGYLSGDGYVVKNQSMVNSIDRQLLLDFKEGLSKFGIQSYLHKVKDFHKEFIIRKEYDCKPLYNLQILDKEIFGSPKVYFKDGLQYSQIRKIEVVEQRATVYDIKTNGNFLVPGAIVHNSEYMNDPISNESAPIKEGQIRIWKELPSQISFVITIDPAYKDDEKSDYKVASLIGIDQQSNRYLAHYIRTHIPQGEFIDAVLNLWLQYRGQITALGIPNSGTEIEFFRSFTNQASQRKLYPPITEVKNTFITASGDSKRGKLARITAALQPLFEQGKYYIGESHKEAKEELLTLGSAIHDDIPDTMCYAEQLLQPVFMDTSVKSGGADEVPRLSNNYGYE